jgi:hypothetical protein
LEFALCLALERTKVLSLFYWGSEGFCTGFEQRPYIFQFTRRDKSHRRFVEMHKPTLEQSCKIEYYNIQRVTLFSPRFPPGWLAIMHGQGSVSAD